LELAKTRIFRSLALFFSAYFIHHLLIRTDVATTTLIASNVAPSRTGRMGANTTDELIYNGIRVCYLLLAGDKHWDETVIVALGSTQRRRSPTIAASFLLFFKSHRIKNTA
jgi:hypothetical protein